MLPNYHTPITIEEFIKSSKYRGFRFTIFRGFRGFRFTIFRGFRGFRFTIFRGFRGFRFTIFRGFRGFSSQYSGGSGGSVHNIQTKITTKKHTKIQNNYPEYKSLPQ